MVHHLPHDPKSIGPCHPPTKVTLTWFEDTDVLEQWGFLKNQVTAFHLTTPGGETLRTWHVLPLELHQRYQAKLRDEQVALT